MLKPPTDYELDLPINVEEIKKELNYREKGSPSIRWATVTLSPQSSWVKDLTKIWFRSRFIYLIPLGDLNPAYAAALIIGKEKLKDTYKVLSAFIASLSWSHDIPLTIQHAGGGTSPTPIGYLGSRVSMLISSVDRDLIPEPEEKKAQLALSFYREGLALDSPFYSFLSFFKIINIVKNTGSEQIKWINENIDKLDHFSQERRKKLIENDAAINIGKYLYENGRCAIAHAYSEPIVDPDNWDDQERLREDKVLIKELSILAIEEFFHVKSPKSSPINRGPRIQKLLDIFRPSPLAEEILGTTIPFIIMNIRGRAQNKLTEKLYFYRITKEDNNRLITVDTVTECRKVMVRFRIDTKENDLFIDCNQLAKLSTECLDDKTKAEFNLNGLTFTDDLFIGRQIRIYCPEGNLLASSSGRPLLGLGFSRNYEAFKKEIEDAKKKLTEFI